MTSSALVEGARGRRRLLAATVAAAIALALSWIPTVAAGAATTLPDGFYERSVLSGLDAPTAVAFAPDGRIFVAQQAGLIKVFDSFDDTTPAIYADLRRDVFYGGDRGLLDLVLDPDFADNGFVYVIYTYSAPIGAVTPYYGYDDGTANPAWPDFCTDRCDVGGRVERLHRVGTGPLDRTVLVGDDWCEQYTSHSIGSLAFDADGNLLAGGGDGADYNTADYGQDIPNSNPDYKANPCADPPGPQFTGLTAPTAEGGALRSQDLRTTGDPLGLSGSIIRIDPSTGAGVPANPLYDSAHPSANRSRILAYGLRNPFRFTVSPADGHVWLGDVGWRTWEELDSFDPAANTPANFGWPCYEGSARQPEYEAVGLNICNNLYAEGPGAVHAPQLQYSHFAPVYPGDPCAVPGDGSAITGVAFYDGGAFPSGYDGGLFFTDYARHCIWWAPAGAGGAPDLTHVQAFDQGVAAPVGLEIGPDGALYYPDIALGAVFRVQHSAGNRPPEAKATATPSSGDLPLTVQFDALAAGNPSVDPDPGDTLSFAWDLDGDGAYDDSTDPAPSHTYAAAAVVNVGLRVSDDHGLTDSDTVRIDAGNSPPVATITGPTAGLQWATGDPLEFQGVATDPDEGALPASALDWKIQLHHCVSVDACHTHLVASFQGADFEIAAPDHYYPAYLSATLTATDSQGLKTETTLDLQPATVALTAQTQPQGLQVALDGVSGPAPLSVTAIRGSVNSVSTRSPQALGASTFEWRAWSDGGGRAHDLVGDASKTLTASFDDVTPTDPGDPTIAPDTPGDGAPPPAPADPIALEVLRMRLPRQAAKLAEHGANALVRCSAACTVRVSLRGEGRAARKAGLAGEIARASRALEAGASGRVEIQFHGAPKRALAAIQGARPRIVASFAAEPRG